MAKKSKKKKTVVKKTVKVILPTESTKPATSIKDYLTCFYGPMGVGKTTFVNGMAKNVLFISSDHGTRFLVGKRAEVHNFTEFFAVLKALEAPGAFHYDIICLDHLDDICVFVEDNVCEVMGIEALGDVGYGAGWRAYKKALKAMTQRLLRIGSGVVFITHETIKTIRTSVIETERTMPDLSKSAWKTIMPICDIVGYCGFKTVKRQGKKEVVRILETTPRESLYCKDRTNRYVSSRGFDFLDSKMFVDSFKKQGVANGKKKTAKKKKSRRAR